MHTLSSALIPQSKHGEDVSPICPMKMKSPEKEISVSQIIRPKIAKYGSPDRVLQLGSAKLQCYVLEDGTRVIADRSAKEAIGLSSGVKTSMRTLAEGLNLSSSVLGSKTMRTLDAIPFKRTDGPISYGMEAEMLPILCLRIIELNVSGSLPKRYSHLVPNALQIVLGTSVVGITALVDEVTGYQSVRERDALQKLVELYVTDEFQPWTKRFPDTFFRELCRLNHWGFDGTSRKMPKYFGKKINDVVYERLPAGVKDALLDRNTARRKRHHQFLTGDIGVPELKNHITFVTESMKGFNSWSGFVSFLDKVKPVPGGIVQYACFEPNEITVDSP